MITIKIGGSVVDDLHQSTISDIKKIAETEGIIIVHGGGKEVTKVCKQLGKEPKFVTSPSGIKSRYTDKETAEIFTMVMSGRINKTIVQMLQKNGINAIGLSGVDAKVIEADRKKKLLIMNEKGRKQAIDGGYTGKITNVNSEFIKSLLEKGLTPVISPIAISEEAEFLNIDGDRAAAYVAGSVKSDKVLFSGDTILGNSSSSVRNLKEYLSTLEIMARQKPNIICPGHGDIIPNGRQKIQWYIDHRLAREAQILKALEHGPVTIEESINLVYPKNLRKNLRNSAARNIHTHLAKLKEEGRIQESDSKYSLV